MKKSGLINNCMYYLSDNDVNVKSVYKSFRFCFILFVFRANFEYIFVRIDKVVVFFVLLCFRRIVICFLYIFKDKFCIVFRIVFCNVNFCEKKKIIINFIFIAIIYRG